MANHRLLRLPFNLDNKSDPLAYILAFSLLIFMPLAFGYLAVSGQWFIAAAILLFLPAFILIVRNPFLAIFIWLAIGPFIIVIPSSMQPVYWLVHRLLPVGALTILWINNIIGLQTRKFPKPNIAEWSMLLYVLISLVSVITTNNDPFDVITVLYDRVLIPMSLYFLIRIWSPKEKDIKQLIPMLIVLVFSQVSIGLLAWFYPSVLPNYWLDWAGQRTTGSLRSYGAFVSAMLFAGLPILHTALNSESGLWRRILFIGFFLSIFGAFFSFSRAGWLALAVVIGCLIYLYPKGMLRSILVLIPVSNPACGWPPFWTDRMGKRAIKFSRSSEASALSRLPTFMASVRMFQDRPIFGWGYENFNEYDFQFYSRVGDLVNPEKDHSSHNFFMTLLAEQGMIGFILFMFPAFYWLLQTKRTISNFPTSGFMSRKLLLILWLFPLAFAILNLFQSMTVIYALGIYWLNLGLIASLVAPHLQTSQAAISTQSDLVTVFVEAEK